MSAKKIFKNAEEHLLEKVFKALAHKTRRHILVSIKRNGGEMTAGEIAAEHSCSWPTVTRHLKVLENAGILETEKEGNFLIYKIINGPILSCQKVFNGALG